MIACSCKAYEKNLYGKIWVVSIIGETVNGWFINLFLLGMASEIQ